jgi:protein disulfide isomerase
LAGGKYKDTVVIFRKDEEPIQFNEDKLSKTKVVSWITSEGYPLYEEISQPVWQRSQQADKPVVVVFVDITKPDQLQIVKDVAKKFKGKVVVAHAVLPTNKALAERWGASGKLFPTGILADWKGTNQPVMTIFNEDVEEEAFSLAAATKFVEGSLEDKYEGYVKSEPEPKTNDDPTTIVTARTFNKLVNDPEKDVFVEFYAPWCGHCKKLAPIWDELATKLQGNSHIRIAKMDATANTVPKNLAVKGFPTLIFFPANNKNPGVTFNGDRDLEALSKFVKETSTKPVKEDL